MEGSVVCVCVGGVSCSEGIATDDDKGKVESGGGRERGSRKEEGRMEGE